jgi:hypothetical protein
MPSGSGGKRAIEILTAYIRLDPFHPPMPFLLLGLAHFMLKENALAQTQAVLGKLADPRDIGLP